jgi:gamma-glutamylcyclotransferase (GGCT)/AIG2-like uncharacterized protein YtfP
MAGQEFLGVGQSVSGYTLYDLGDYPGLVASEDSTPVYGEV